MIKLLLMLLIPSLVFAAPPTRLNSYSPNTTISSTDVSENENSLFNYLQAGVDTYLDSSIFNADISASANIQSDKLNLSSVSQNIVSSGTITASSFSGGGALPSGAVFFMASGSCPSWTTDITATYNNKFIKINATQLTSSGVVLTGTTDSTAITQANLPSYNLSFTRYDSNGSGSTGVQGTTNGASASSQTVASGGSGTGHTHTLSTATTLEPSSITMKACKVI